MPRSLISWLQEETQKGERGFGMQVPSIASIRLGPKPVLHYNGSGKDPSLPSLGPRDEMSWHGWRGPWQPQIVHLQRSIAIGLDKMTDTNETGRANYTPWRIKGWNPENHLMGVHQKCRKAIL